MRVYTGVFMLLCFMLIPVIVVFRAIDAANQKNITSMNSAVENLDVSSVSDLVKEDTFNNKNEIESVMKLKAALVTFHNAESKVSQIRECLKITTSSNPMFYPIMTDLINSYDQSKKYIDSISYDGDNEFNYSYNYLKGCIYYRYLRLFSDQTTAPEFFKQSLDSFKKCLQYKDKDINAIINLELLVQGRGKKQDDGEPKELEMIRKKFGTIAPKGKF